MTATNLPIVMIQIVPMTPIAQGAHALVILLIIRSPVKVIAFLQVPTAATDKEDGVRLVVNAGMEAAAPLNEYAMVLFACQKDASVVIMVMVVTAPQIIQNAAHLRAARLTLNAAVVGAARLVRNAVQATWDAARTIAHAVDLLVAHLVITVVRIS